jgi:hypothetical protein
VLSYIIVNGFYVTRLLQDASKVLFAVEEEEVRFLNGI